MAERRGWATLLSAIGAISILAALFVIVGPQRVVDALVSADSRLVGVTIAFSLGWLFAWSLMLRTVLSTLDVTLSIPKATLVYAGAVFSNNVTPFGQAGGEPIAALLISKVSGSRYETGLAGIATVDVLNVLPSVSLIAVGVSYHATTTALSDRVEAAVGSAAALIVAVILILWILWRYQAVVLTRVPSAIGWVARRLSRLGIDPVAIELAIADRLSGFADRIGVLSENRAVLVGVLGFSLAGWLCQAAALGAAFAAIGQPIPLYVPLFVVPLSYLAGAAPLPGGLGGIEAALVALLVPTTGVAVASITAAVLVFRGGMFWLPTAIGGVSASVLGVQAVDRS